MGSGASTSAGACLCTSENGTPISSWADLKDKQTPVDGSEELSLHLRGVSGHFLVALLRMPEFKEECTTGEFCWTFVKPITEQFKCSFVRLGQS